MHKSSQKKNMVISLGITTGELVAEIARRLVKLRIERGWTQGELAERVGVSKSSVERLESGDGNPKLTTFVAVCGALGLTERFNVLLPEPTPTPFEVFSKKKTPKRVRHSKARAAKWKWGEKK